MRGWLHRQKRTGGGGIGSDTMARTTLGDCKKEERRELCRKKGLLKEYVPARNLFLLVNRPSGHGNERDSQELGTGTKRYLCQELVVYFNRERRSREHCERKINRRERANPPDNKEQ